MNRTAFVISIVLTTFVLMAVGGIAYAVNLPATPQAQTEEDLAFDETTAGDPSLAQAVAPAAEQITDPALQQALNERESAYQQLIAEANARIAQAQQQQIELQAQVNALQGGAAPAAAQGQLTLEQAAQIAANFLGQGNVYSVEVVTIRDQSLYKVTFYSGDIVYVSMDGQIAGSASASFGLSAGDDSVTGGGASILTGSGGGGGDDDHGENDDDDDDEHDDD